MTFQPNRKNPKKEKRQVGGETKQGYFKDKEESEYWEMRARWGGARGMGRGGEHSAEELTLA